VALLNEALHEQVIVRQDGRPRKMSKLRVIITQLVNKAMQGDLRSQQLLLLNQIPLIEKDHAELHQSGGLSHEVAMSIRKALLGEE
jgi:hypothetical protein